MKFILKILVVLLFMAVVLTVVAAFLPKNQKLVAMQEINLPPSMVYEQLVDFRNWTSWAPWIANDTNMQVDVKPPFRGKQAQMTWKSIPYGKGHLKMIHAVPPESIAVEFNLGQTSQTTGLWYLEPTSLGCNVNWSMNLSNLGLFERILFRIKKKELEHFMQQGLTQLNQHCIGLKYSRTGEISLIEMPVVHTVMVKESLKPDQTNEQIGNMVATLNSFLNNRQLQAAGQWFRLVPQAEQEGSNELFIGIPLHERTWVWASLQYYALPAGKTLVQSHFGRPSNTGKAHSELKEYMRQNGYSLNGDPWEVPLYASDSTMSDTSLFETLVYYPVK
ncbi:MAG: SRPBCC family protein [Bacteroidota bacterium]|nr:MAG: SRPBCC family protein [Bacteroidota bacterium]